MNQMLAVKERIIHVYQKAGIILVPAMKFLVTFLVFVIINSRMGYDSRFSGLGVSLLLALFGALVPVSVTVFLAAVLILIHIYCVSKILAVIVLLFFLVFYLMFIRFTPKQGYALFAIPILMPLNMAYLIPLLLGMTGGPLSIVCAACGVAVYYLLDVVREAAQISVNNSVEDILALYRFVIDSLLDNKEMFLTMVIFALVILVTYFLRKMKYDHAFGIAIASGTMVMTLGFLFGNIRIKLEAGIVNMLLGCVFSALIMAIIQFFKLTLDYTAVERTQFEDDDYYYYVKAVPKIKLTAPEKNVVTLVPSRDEKDDEKEIPVFKRKEEDNFEFDAFELEETVDSRKLADSVQKMQKRYGRADRAYDSEMGRTSALPNISGKNKVDEELKTLTSFTDDINDFNPIEINKRRYTYKGKYGKNSNRK